MNSLFNWFCNLYQNSFWLGKYLTILIENIYLSKEFYIVSIVVSTTALYLSYISMILDHRNNDKYHFFIRSCYSICFASSTYLQLDYSNISIFLNSNTWGTETFWIVLHSSVIFKNNPERSCAYYYCNYT
jgi:hypothetical protein